jgi:hypothetical protein
VTDQCQLCGKHTKLIKAHVIPASFLKPLRGDNQLPRIFSSEPGVFPRRSHSGVYEEDLLCADCDAEVGIWDNYAYQTLVKPFEGTGEKPPLDALDNLTLTKFDYDRLKLFFISLIWRADRSTHDFFSAVDLGRRWRSRARQMILRKDPGKPDEFGVNLVRHEHRLARKTLHSPKRARHNGINFYILSLGSFAAMIRVDSRPFDPIMQPFLLRRDHPLVVPIFPYEESTLYRDTLEHFKTGAFQK